MERESPLGLALQYVCLTKIQVCPQQFGLEADCFLKQASALRKPLLLKSDGTEDGTSGGSCLRIRKSNLSLLLCLL
jgi:hypothetical protein